MSASVAGAPPLTTPSRVPVGGVLTPRMERLIRVGSVGSALVIAVSAMVLSYAGLHDLALDARIHPNLALLVPIMVDGLQFVGSLGVVYSTLSGLRTWYPWLLLLMGVSISAWGNWQAAPADMTAKLLHAAAPVILALVLEELLRVMRHKVHLHTVAWEASHGGSEHQISHLDIADKPVGSHDEVEGETGPAVPVGDPTAPGDLQEPGTQVPAVHEAAADPAPAAKVVPAPEVAVPDEETGQADTWTLRDPVIPASALRSPGQSEVAPASGQSAAEEAGPAAPVSVPDRVQTAPRVEVGAESKTEPRSIGGADGDRGVPVPMSAEVTSTASTVAEEGTGEEGEETLPPYSERGTFKDQIKSILLADPNTPAAKIARVMGKDPSYTRKVVREARAELDAEATPGLGGSTPGTTSAPGSGVRESAHGDRVDDAVVAKPSGAGDDLDDADPFAMSAPVYATR